MKTIPCSVGILTFNSEKTLRRALESVKGFSNIIISDGGSTDSTIDIAMEYGCMIIEQYTKNNPGSDKYHPVEDFARERNILLDSAKEDWFLWIDSDEYISLELYTEISNICINLEPDFLAYEVPIAVQSPDAKITYKRSKEMHQIRFFNLKTEGRFERFMHERFVFDRDKFLVGKLRGTWNVPISKPDFLSYSRAVNYRIRVMLGKRRSKSFFEYLRRGIFVPLKRTVGVFYRYVSNIIQFGSRDAMPFFYYRNQLYSHWVTFVVISELYFKNEDKY